jgi:hypothetical protein
MTSNGNQVRVLDPAQRRLNETPDTLVSVFAGTWLVVGLGGVEPPTSSLSAKCR